MSIRRSVYLVLPHYHFYVATDIMDRNDAFVQAVRASATPADKPVECTNFTGGGIRFSGFKSIPCRKFLSLLHEFGKRAVFRMDTLPNAVLADCYDNIDPVAEPAIDDPSICAQLALEAVGAYRRGAVVYTPYRSRELNSEIVARILMAQSTLDCILQHHYMTLMVVHSASTSIVGGLQSQLQNNVRSQRSRNPRKIMFSATAPSFKRVALSKKKSDKRWTLASLLSYFK